MTPTELSCPCVGVEPQQQRTDGIGFVAVEAVPRHDAVGGSLVLDLEHDALVLGVGRRQRLGHDAVEPCPLELGEPLPGDVPVAGGPGEVDRWFRVGQRLRQGRTALGERTLGVVRLPEREQVERDEAGRGLAGQLGDPRRRGMDPLLQQVEVEPVPPSEGRP
jgi:hypothetical protein